VTIQLDDNLKKQILSLPSINLYDSWFVINRVTNKILQSEFTEQRANAACLIVREHDEKNGHVSDFIVVKLKSKNSITHDNS